MIRLNGDIADWHEGLTLLELLRPGSTEPHMVVVCVDDQIVPRYEYATKLIPNGADVKIVQLMDGG